MDYSFLDNNIYDISPDEFTHIYGTTLLTGPSYSRMWDSTTPGNPYVWASSTYEDLIKHIKKEEEELAVEVINVKSSRKNEHIMACQNEKDLSQENILVTISAVKGKLMFEIAPIHVKKIECSMTPQVRANLVAAGKRIRMYGKKAPIVPCFDEMGNRLPDLIEIGGSSGITVKIVDPKDYGKLYFELKATEFSPTDYDSCGWVNIYH